METFAVIMLLVGLILIVFPLAKIGISKEIIKIAKDQEKGLFVPIPQPGAFSFLFVSGRLVRILENVVGWELRQCPDGPYRFFKVRNQVEKIHDFAGLGAVWVGFYAKLKKFEKWWWTEFGPKKDAQGNPVRDDEGNVVYETISREKDLYEFLHQFTYSIDVVNMELAGNIQAKVTTLVTIYVLDPSRAFIEVKGWVETLYGYVQAAVAGWTGGKDFDSIKAEMKDTSHNSDFNEMLRRLNGIELESDGNPKYETMENGGLAQVLGVVIWNSTLQNLEATGTAAEALRQEKENELLGNAAIKKAEKDKLVKMKQAEADAEVDGIRLAARKKWVTETIVEPTGGAGPQVAEVLAAEQIASPGSKVNVYVRGSGTNVSLPVEPNKK